MLSLFFSFRAALDSICLLLWSFGLLLLEQLHFLIFFSSELLFHYFLFKVLLIVCFVRVSQIPCRVNILRCWIFFVDKFVVPCCSHVNCRYNVVFIFAKTDSWVRFLIGVIALSKINVFLIDILYERWDLDNMLGNLFLFLNCNVGNASLLLVMRFKDCWIVLLHLKPLLFSLIFQNWRVQECFGWRLLSNCGFLRLVHINKHYFILLLLLFWEFIDVNPIKFMSIKLRRWHIAFRVLVFVNLSFLEEI